MIWEILHWAALVVALLVSYRLFRDLADLSQWIVQTPRSKTMWTFYHRHQLAAVSVASWLIAAATLWVIGSGFTWAFVIVSVVVLLLFYSGYVNPGIMMRSQQFDARYVWVEEARKHVSPDDSVIVLEAHGEARAHPLIMPLPSD